MVRCEMWCDVYVKCGAMWNVSCNFRHGLMLNVIEMCDVGYEMRCGIDEECGICNVLCDCCEMSDVENDTMCCDVRCGAVM